MSDELQILKTFADNLEQYLLAPDAGIDFSKIHRLKDNKRPTEDRIDAYLDYLTPFILTDIPDMPPLIRPMFVENDLVGMPGEKGTFGIYQNAIATHDLIAKKCKQGAQAPFIPMPKYQQLLHEFYTTLLPYMQKKESERSWLHYKNWNFMRRGRRVSSLEEWTIDTFTNAKTLAEYKRLTDAAALAPGEPAPSCCKTKVNLTCRTFSYGMALGVIQGIGSGAIVIYANVHQPGGVIFVLFSTLLGVSTPTVIYPSIIHNKVPERIVTSVRDGVGCCWKWVSTRPSLLTAQTSNRSISMSPIDNNSSTASLNRV